MKKILPFLIANGGVYLVISYIRGTFDIINLDIDGRFILVFLLFIVNGVCLIVVNDKPVY